jgi:hypothetical protein
MRILKKIQRFLIDPSAQRTAQRASATPTEHPILGSLVPDKTFPHDLIGRAKFCSSYIELHVSPDDKPLEVTLELAVALVESLEQFDAKCRNLLGVEFLDGYNTDWRFAENTLQSSGAFKSIEKPLLTMEEFCMNLKLESIEASGDAILTFWYGDGDMFGGHSLEVTSFDGPAFGDTYVSMAG